MTDQVHVIHSAPVLIAILFGIVAMVVLAVTSRGREFLATIGRPLPALLLSALGAGMSGLMTTIALTCFFLRPPYVNIKGVVSVFLFGLLLGFPIWVPVILVWSLPVFIVAWLPLWLARRRFAAFWGWPTAPLTGGVLAYVSWLTINAVQPLFPEGYLHREFIVAAHVAAFVNGFCMFALGCRLPTFRRRTHLPTGAISPASVAGSDNDRA